MHESSTGPNGLPWSEGRGPLWLQLALVTFAILVLELAIIRWVGAQIRLAAYFANLVLLATFLGMGLGVGLGRRHPQWFRFCLPLLALVALLLGFSDSLGLMHLRFPDPSISLWGAEGERTLGSFLAAAAFMLGFFWLLAGVFLLAGIPVGALFGRMQALKAYGADLLGSLLGVVAMTLVAWLVLPPPIWLALGVAPLLWLSRSLWAAVAAVVVVAAGAYSIKDATFSPYNRIDLAPLESVGAARLSGSSKPEWILSVNRDFHQYMFDLSNRDSTSESDQWREFVRAVYELPFRSASHKGRALVVGAGTGNDVAAAQRVGFSEIVSVDIDPAIIAMGTAMHPEQPYAQASARPVVNDARAYFEQNPPQGFDVLCYGLLDSHAMFSAMSSLRLDNFVYTREGLAAGWRHVADDGVMSVSFSAFAGPWMVQRLYLTLREATGLTPIVVPHGMHDGATLLVGRRLDPAAVQALMPGANADFQADRAIRVPTDDWPYLYLRPGQFPWTYVVVLIGILLSGAAAVRGVFGQGIYTGGRFDAQMFCLGAAFMLLETRLVTELSLLFGSTWIVNSSVFGAILLMVLLANYWVLRRPPRRLELWFVPLALALLATWYFGAGALNRLPLLERGLAGGVLFALPVFFAGVVFSSLLRRSRDTAAALGSNLCGAVLGGVLEYLSMLTGLRAITLLALAFYLGALYVGQRKTAVEVPAN